MASKLPVLPKVPERLGINNDYVMCLCLYKIENGKSAKSPVVEKKAYMTTEQAKISPVRFLVALVRSFVYSLYYIKIIGDKEYMALKIKYQVTKKEEN